MNGFEARLVSALTARLKYERINGCEIRTRHNTMFDSYDVRIDHSPTGKHMFGEVLDRELDLQQFIDQVIDPIILKLLETLTS